MLKEIRRGAHVPFAQTRSAGSRCDANGTGQSAIDRAIGDVRALGDLRRARASPVSSATTTMTAPHMQFTAHALPGPE